jgi:protein TonB
VPDGTDAVTPTPVPPTPKFILPTMEQPQRIAGADPAYTPEAKAARVTGDVRLRVCFDTSGAVTTVDVKHGLPMGLTESAIRAVRGWRYRPYLMNGQAVPGCLFTKFAFRLE